MKVFLNTLVKQVEEENGRFSCLRLEDGTKVSGDGCIVATGGLSYQTTGSTGDGYTFAEMLGHQVTECMPALVPMTAKEEWVSRLQGLSLRNVNAVIRDGKKKLYDDFGEMLFTHYGVSGPLMLSASSVVGKKFKDKRSNVGKLELEIDLKPALSMEQLDQRVLRDFEKIRKNSLKMQSENYFRQS